MQRSAFDSHALGAAHRRIAVTNERTSSGLNIIRRRKDRVLVQPDELIIDRETGMTFERGRFLGRGGFASVYEVVPIRNNGIREEKILACKVICFQGLEDRHKRKLQKEISIHSGLCRNRTPSHPNIVNFHSWFRDDSCAYVVMERCDYSLQDVIKRQHIISEADCSRVFASVIKALIHLHERDIIHRDIKPGNIFFAEGDIKIGDFGMAGSVQRERRSLCGTPNYLAPELLKGDSYGKEVDIWTVGIAMYICLFGKAPFSSDNNEPKAIYASIKRGQFSFPQNSRVSNTARSIIRLMLRHDPKDRITLYRALRHEFFREHYELNWSYGLTPLPNDDFPFPFVVQWLHDTHKHGHVALMSNGAVSVIFNDMTRGMMMPNDTQFYYRTRSSVDTISFSEFEGMTLKQGDPSYDLSKKCKLMKYWHSRLVKNCRVRPRHPNFENVWLKACHVTDDAIGFRISNQVFQVRFIDNFELVLSIEHQIVLFRHLDEEYVVNYFSTNPVLRKRLNRLKALLPSLSQH
ncbi:hypothetical protein PCE1_000394 [Barthelona sp. PCE]